jgi:hypothetical protein
MANNRNDRVSNLPTLPKLGIPTFISAAGARPTASKFGNGGVSVRVADAVLPLYFDGGSVNLPITMWGAMTQKPDVTEYTVSASLPRGVTCTDRDELLGHVERHALRWSGFAEAYDAGQKALTGERNGKRPVMVPPTPKQPLLVKPTGQRVAPDASAAASETAQPAAGAAS